MIYYPACPFPLPRGDDLAFLLGQQLASRAHKNVSYDPRRDRAAGFHRQSAEQAERLRGLLAEFAAAPDAPGWPACCPATPPPGSGTWSASAPSRRRRGRPGSRRATTCCTSMPSRPGRPTAGASCAASPTSTRPSRASGSRRSRSPVCWSATARRRGCRAGTAATGCGACSDGVLRLFRPGRPSRSPYDAFMLRLHDHLKASDEFQERGPKQFWKFPPGSAWLAITDTCSHAVLRGRFALEHSYFARPGVAGAAGRIAGRRCCPAPAAGRCWKRRPDRAIIFV